MTTRNYSNTVAPTSVASPGITTSGQTTIPVTSASGFPAVPFTIGVDRGTADSEAMLVTAKDTVLNTFTVSRGYDGTTAVAHLTGASVEHTFVSKDFQEANDHIEDEGRDDHPQYLNETRLEDFLPHDHTATGADDLASITTTYQQVNTITIPSATYDRKVQFHGMAPCFGSASAVYRARLLRGASTVHAANYFSGATLFSIPLLSGWVTIPAGDTWTVAMQVKRDSGSGGTVDDDATINKLTATTVRAL